jgi:putative ABC transport system permease protein
LNSFFQDLRYGVRMLAKSPGFTFVALLTLALGIGANTAIFSIVDAVLLRPLPYKDASRLVNLHSTLTYFPQFHLGESPADFVDIRAQNQFFDSMAMYRMSAMNLTGEGNPEEISAGAVSADLFPMLGVRPFGGRWFIEEEEQPGKDSTAILSHGLWQRRFGADPGAMGKHLTLNGKLYTIVGIMPSGFRFPQKTDLWIPLALAPADWREREMHGTEVLAKLKPGVELPRVQAELNTIASRLANQYPNVDQGLGLLVVPLQEASVGGVRPALLVLLGAVGFVLLIACANVGNLTLARSLKRQREMAIRATLGASRSRIARQLLVESLLLALTGGALGLLLAMWGVDALRSFAPANTPRLDELRVDPGVLWFSFAISALAGILFGLVPAVQSSRPDLNSSLKEHGAAPSGKFEHHRLRSVLVVSEVALALVLLTGSALAIQSFSRLTSVNPGFRTDHLLTLSIHLPSSKYPKDSQQINFAQQLLEKVKPLPGVISVAGASMPYLRGRMSLSTIQIEGAPSRSDSSSDNVEFKAISPGLFETMGIRLLKGRDFDSHDVAGTLRIVAVSESLAHRYWPGANPIGKRVSLDQDPDGHPIWSEVVGVVSDTRDIHFDVAPKAVVYVPLLQIGSGQIILIVRTTADPVALAAAVRSQVWAVDPDQPITDLLTMEQVVSESVAAPRFRTLLLGIFAGLGLVLTILGTYGVISYSVSQRTHEIGIRIALGAHPHDILALVIGQGIKLALTGVAIGVCAALVLTRWMASLLYGISATDPLTFAAVAILLTAVALAACYVPARRATRVDPMVALRYE